jgi:Zn-dependent protease
MARITPGRVLWGGIAAILAVAAFNRGQLGRGDLIYFAVLIPSVILHEISHGALANLFGDDTAKRAGRLTLNPIKHVDLFGTIILPALLVLFVGTAFGYAKPVPVNTTRMSRNKAMFVGLIGPATNIVIAVIAGLVLRSIVDIHGPYYDLTGPDWFADVVFQLGIANVVLAVFNMIPIPPLDGASVIERFLPSRHLMTYYRFRQYAMLLLLVVVLMGGSFLGHVFQPFVDVWWKLVVS